MKQIFLKLNWDSNFFNFIVGKITGPINKKQDIINVDYLIQKNKSKLSYYSSHIELATFEIKNLNIILVDKKITYVKVINPNLEINKSISTLGNIPPNEKLINLAIQSGIYSRFKVDKNISKDKFEEMYRLWMINSLSRKIANEVFAFNENNEIAGFVTLGEKNNRADIGIIAVDNQFRGNGIGKKLMMSAEKWFSNSGYKSIQVVTQGNNVPACKLYEKCGYTIESVEYFYHIWNKRLHPKQIIT